MSEEKITITEGEPNPDNNVDIHLDWIEDEWVTVFGQYYHEWSQNDLTDWLIDRLDAPETLTAAIEDERVHVNHLDHEYKEPEIAGFKDQVARATYYQDNVEWTVEVLL